MITACIAQAQADGLANTDVAFNMYVPQLEHIIVSTLKALSVSSLISGADQTILLAQIALAAADPQ